MLTTPFGIGATSRVGSALSAVNIVAIQPLAVQAQTDWSSLTIRFDSPTGKMLVLFSSRSNSSNPEGFSSVTWGGEALDGELDVETNAVGGALGWAGWIDDGASGEQDLIVTATATKQRDLFGYAISFDRMAAVPIGGKNGASVRTEQSAYGVPVTAASAQGRLISLVCAMSSTPRPYNVSAGWTLIGPTSGMPTATGPNGTADISGVLGQRLAGAPGSYTMTGASSDVPPDSVTDDWVALALEVLPA